MSVRHRANRAKVRILRSRSRLSPRLSTPLARVVREPAEIVERLARFGLEPVDVIEAPVESLHVHRPVRCEVIPSREASTLGFLDRYFIDGSGRPDWRISRSMQFRLLDAHRRGDLPDDLTTTDYWQWHVRLREAGINERPDELIARKLRGLIAIYESMRETGYRFERLASYVWVLDRPLIASRYGYERLHDGLEIFDGHHRAAAAACLGYETLHVLMLRDVGRETAFGVPLSEVVIRRGEGTSSPGQELRSTR